MVFVAAEAAMAAPPTAVVADVVEAEAAIACAPFPAVVSAWRAAVLDCGKNEATPTSRERQASPTATAPGEEAPALLVVHARHLG